MEVSDRVRFKGQRAREEKSGATRGWNNTVAKKQMGVSKRAFLFQLSQSSLSSLLFFFFISRSVAN